MASKCSAHASPLFALARLKAGGSMVIFRLGFCYGLMVLPSALAAERTGSPLFD